MWMVLSWIVTWSVFRVCSKVLDWTASPARRHAWYVNAKTAAQSLREYKEVKASGRAVMSFLRMGFVIGESCDFVVCAVLFLMPFRVLLTIKTADGSGY